VKTRSTFKTRMTAAFPLWVISLVMTKEPTPLYVLGTGFVFLFVTAGIDMFDFIHQRRRARSVPVVRGPVPGTGGTGGACPAPPLVRLEIRHQNQTGVIVKITASGPVSLDVVDEQMNLEKTFTLLENECVVMTLDEIGNL
jgi:hypothetical protein